MFYKDRCYMKANGFTLVEILGVVVILSLIVILAFPSIIENIRKSETEISDATMLLVESAADLYMENNKTDYPSEEGNVYCIALSDLVKSGQLRKPFIDTTTKEEINVDTNSVQVEIKTDDNIYEIVKNDSCSEIRK